LPGRLAFYLGPASWLAFAIVGVMLVTVALCFAEAAGMFDATGGPYVYAREAFGEPVGFGVAWISWVTGVTSLGAVANAIPGYLAYFVPELNVGAWPKIVVLLVVGGLGVVNYLGVRPGAFTTNLFTVAKLAPLFVFVIVGIWYVAPERVSVAPPEGAQLGTAMFVALFPLQGFEAAPVPAGETQNARRNVPIAVVGALVGSAIFYVLIQIVAHGTQPDIASSAALTTPDKPWATRPLADAAETFLGQGGAALMALGACISMTGYCAGSALVNPRFLQALADDRLLAAPLGRLHPRFGSPHVAVAINTACTLVAGLTLDFDKLVDISNVAVIFQYVSTCAAVTRLRYSHPDQPRTTRVPGGPWIVPVLGIGVCILLAVQATWVEYAFSLGTLAVGALIAIVTRRLAK
jgi:amino acid transporter